VYLGALRRDRLEHVGGQPRPGEQQRPRGLVGNHRVEIDRITVPARSRVGEQGRHSPFAAAGIDHELSERLVPQLGHQAERNGLAILDSDRRLVRHRCTAT
jgi:hypothetical protein